MQNYSIAIDYKQLRYDARANSWKTGGVAPREDGLHGEVQMSDGAMDTKILARLLVDATGLLCGALHDFYGSGDDDRLPQLIDDVVAGFEDADFVRHLYVRTSGRNNAVVEELNALAHEFMLGYVMAGWYKLVDPRRMASWEARREDAKTRLLGALRHKTEPA